MGRRCAEAAAERAVEIRPQPRRELAKLAASGSRPDAKVIGELRSRYDTDQLSALKVN